MGEELNLDYILTGDEVENLFSDDANEDGAKDDKEKKEPSSSTEVNPETLFEEDPESVGSEEGEDISQEGTGDSGKGASTSPKDLYSSLATVLREEGALADFPDERIKEVKSAEDLVKLFDELAAQKLDEKQKRVEAALAVDVEAETIRQYENAISFFEGIDEAAIKDEGEDGENLRRQLIYQDYLNRGFDESQAMRKMEASFKAASDIEDALDALKNNKKYFKDSYDSIISEAKAKKESSTKEKEQQLEELKKLVLESQEPFAGLKLDKATRQKVYDNLSKPIYKDESGKYYTAIQKAGLDNPTEFMQKLGVVYTLTNGFKDLDGLVKGKVKQQTKKATQELERILNSTSRDGFGNLNFASGVSDGGDPNSSMRGWDLDVSD